MKTIYQTFLLLLSVILLSATHPVNDRSKTWEASDKAKKFVKENIAIDFYASPYGVGWTKSEHLHDYVDRALSTGITGASATLAATYFTWEDWIKEYGVWRSTMLEQSDKYILVHDVDDIHRAHKEGKYAMIFDSQTTSILNGDLTKIAALRGMGVSSMQLVYNGAYRTGDGVMRYYKGKDGGLTDWGKKVIDEMVKQGIIVDLSHTGMNTAIDISNYMLEKYPGVPFVYTHSLPIGLYENLPDATERGCYRNISDEQAKLAAKSGGVVSPTFTEWMMDGVWPDEISPVQCADMIDYYVKLLGEDHVGIATDDMFTLDILMGFVKKNAASYDDDGYMVNAFNKGADGCAELAKILPAVTDELWKRGYSDEQIKKIYAGNVMRVYKKVWK